jgi:hypothetical protein
MAGSVSLVVGATAVDLKQALSGRLQSQTELRDDVAAIQVGAAVVRGGITRNYSEMRREIKRILCK